MTLRDTWYTWVKKHKHGEAVRGRHGDIVRLALFANTRQHLDIEGPHPVY